uniref:Uncharacterized protein n=1 Tax=Aegilops tauschii subsp. strangulata TaxID=200361 RepID=A0A453GA46_AEGTS
EPCALLPESLLKSGHSGVAAIDPSVVSPIHCHFRGSFALAKLFISYIYYLIFE